MTTHLIRAARPVLPVICAVGLLSTAIAATPIAVSITEGSQYVAENKAPAWVADTSRGVIRTLFISITNISQQELNLDVEFALYKTDAKGDVQVIKMRDVPPKAGSTQLPKKGKQVVSLKPGETKHVRVEGWMRTPPSALLRGQTGGIAVIRPGDDGDPNKIDPHDPLARVTQPPTAPTAVGGGSSQTKTLPEQYYGYSVAIYLGGDIIYKMDKNPKNVPNFGVTALGQ